jgi:hypothetical protein
MAAASVGVNTPNFSPPTMATGSTIAHSAWRVAVSRSAVVLLGSTLILSRPITQRQASAIASPISAPGTMPAMKSLVIDTPPVTPYRIIAIDGGITGAMMPPQAINPYERFTS